MSDGSAIVIDAVTYNIPFEVIGRKAEILFKNAERTQDGALHAEPIGTFYNYDLQMARSEENASEYAALWTKITDPNHEHQITMPDGNNSSLTFTAYFANISDNVRKWKSGGITYYSQLTFSVIGISPARTP